MGHKVANVDRDIAATARRQHGVVSSAQLEEAGLTRSAASKRVKAGRLHRIHRGVYAVGHSRLSNEGRWLAAVLACGEGAALSHTSAAEHLGLLRPRPGPVHVTIDGGGGRAQRPDLRIHRSSLPGSSTVRRQGIEVTTPARTLADLRRTTDPATLRRAIRQAEYLGLETGLSTDRTRSEAEAAFLGACRRHGVPLPEVNVHVGRFTVDFLWRAEGLVVEVDGYSAHRGRQAFEDDRERELELARVGLRLRRYSAGQVRRRPVDVTASVLAELCRADP